MARGVEGITLQAQVGQYIELQFQCPYRSGSAGSVDLNISDLSGAPVTEAFEAADFMTGLSQGELLQIRAGNQPVAALDLSGRKADDVIDERFESIRMVADDLKVIESHTKARFRYPSELSVIDRIMIRNVRLMLEGHCVVHPVANQFNATLDDSAGQGLRPLLTTSPGWLVATQAVGA